MTFFLFFFFAFHIFQTGDLSQAKQCYSACCSEANVKLIFDIHVNISFLFVQVDPKFLRNLRFSKKHNKRNGGNAVKMES